jgi:hypothetical protein
MIFNVFRENHRNAPATVRQEARKKNTALYEQACNMLAASNVPSAGAFAESVVAGAPAHIRRILAEIATQLYQAEGFDPASIPPPPPIPESIEAARYRDRLAEYINKLADPDTFTRFEHAVAQSFQLIVDALPPIEGGPFTVSFLDAVPNAGKLIEQVADRIYPVSASFREQYDMNRCTASRLPFTKESRVSPKLMQPSAYNGTARETVDTFLKSTPLTALSSARLPFGIPEARRGEHWHLLGGSGQGKTQTLSHIIMNDLRKPDPPALIIIDSQNQMLRQIQRLSLFDPFIPGSLSDRLIIVDPEDDFPPALNMFAVNNSRTVGYSRVNREIVEGDILELFNYIFASMEATLSTQMGTAFAYVSQLMLSMQPTATIHTLIEFLQEEATNFRQSKFYPYIAALDPITRNFFEKQFYTNATYKQTRLSLGSRLYNLIKVPAFKRMFASRQNKLSMFDAIQRKSIICVNTSRALLKKDASRLFGRYMIASTMAAIFERVALPDEREWNQAYLVIDEAADYFDENLEELLRKARKYKLGVLFAHHMIEDLKGAMRAQVATNTSIKMCGGINSSDARMLASDMRSTPDFLLSQMKDSRDPKNPPQWADWACYVHTVTPHAVSITVPFYSLRDAPKMSEARYRKLLERNRARYAADPEPEPATTDAPPSAHEKPDEPSAPPNPASERTPRRSTPPKRPRRDPDA